MAAIALLDLVRKSPNFGGQSFTSRSLFSTKLLGPPTLAAAASFTVATPFAFASFFGNGIPRVSYCDAGTEALDGDYMSSMRTASGYIFKNEAVIHSTKQYDIQLKPIFSAFHWKTLAITSVRSFFLYFIPVVERRSLTEEDDEDSFLEENLEEKHVDYVVPFKNSVKQIARETTVSTTRRVLERLAVHYVSQRMAWKLLKDVPKSAMRKAGRGMPKLTYIFSVSRTTCRGHCLGILASWVVQVGIDVYRTLTKIFKSIEDGETVNIREELLGFGKNVHFITARCGASLIFASIGAGIGAALVRPSIGQWVGCAIGEFSGPLVVTFCFMKLQLGNPSQ